MLRKNLEVRMQTLQEKENLSLSAMSRKTGIAKTSLRAILQGAGNPRLSTVEKIARFLRVSSVSLISDQDCGEELQKYIGLVRRLRGSDTFTQARELKAAELLQQMVRILDSV